MSCRSADLLRSGITPTESAHVTVSTMKMMRTWRSALRQDTCSSCRRQLGANDGHDAFGDGFEIAHRVTQRHAGLPRLEDEMVERETRQPGDHLRCYIGRCAEEPAILHESLGHVVRVVAGERLAFAGRRIDVGL